MKVLTKITATLALTACSLMAAEVVNVYSHRHYDADKQLFKQFEEKTGIEVKVVKAKAGELMKRLETEGMNSPADVFITADAGNLHHVKEKGLLQPIDSAILEASVPSTLQDSDNQWFALTKRARVIVYAKDRVKPSELSTYEDLANPKWKGKIMVRSSSNVYNQSLLASMIAHHGEEKATQWAKDVVANMAKEPKGNDRYQVKAIANGVGDIALVNTYYVGKMVDNKDATQSEAVKKIGVFFPNQDDRGTHINISGAGVTKASKNKENAIKLLEFLVSPEAQAIFAQANFEYPVLKGVQVSDLVASWGEFKADELAIENLGINNKNAVKAFDKAGWR